MQPPPWVAQLHTPGRMPGVFCSALRQCPGEFVITFPKAYHFGFVRCRGSSQTSASLAPATTCPTGQATHPNPDPSLTLTLTLTLTRTLILILTLTLTLALARIPTPTPTTTTTLNQPTFSDPRALPHPAVGLETPYFILPKSHVLLPTSY